MAQIVEVKSISNIIIYMLSSDAFGLSLSEAIYLNNIPIVGGWLPYKKFPQNGIHVIELFDFKDLPLLLIDIIKNQHTYEKKCMNNKERVKKLLSPFQNANDWIEIHKSQLDKP